MAKVRVWFIEGSSFFDEHLVLHGEFLTGELGGQANSFIELISTS